ncbi:Imm49 family immunity protein [Paraburkholderia terrae]|uniref:Imm49 family immunity protein n=1 Tax=Paraburkholderia terrae TaxID=311230 RepID=UPI00296AE47F|nr:Imm49 family immunity protein [Paraburkholderia terrae]MDW3656525.1 Imm49 family immunity protein [Paraburkholderia terrae]
MKEIDYISMQHQGLTHVSKHLEFLDGERANLVSMLESNKGSRSGCLRSLRSHADASALVSWFGNSDLAALKQWSYVSAKLQMMLFQLEPKTWYPAYLLLMPLLSDHEGLIQWFAHNDEMFDTSRADDPATAEFHGYQALLAIRGEWGALEDRCHRVIGHSPQKMKKYEIDHNFYLALSQHDVSAMKIVLDELTSPRIAKVRNVEPAFGFTEKLIATHAVIYAKIAWRHGFCIDIETPWIPAAWLPIDPLPQYVAPYNFMK